MEANETTETIAVGRKTVRLKSVHVSYQAYSRLLLIPFVAFFLLFFFTYLRIMPIQYKLIVLGIVYCFTISDADARHLPVPKNKRLGYS